MKWFAGCSRHSILPKLTKITFLVGTRGIAVAVVIVAAIEVAHFIHVIVLMLHEQEYKIQNLIPQLKSKLLSTFIINY